MKRYYLVKGDERHEVELMDGRYNFCKIGHLITPRVAELLGYTLEEQERREWVVCWDNGIKPLIFERDKKKHNWDNEVQVAELREGERVISREDAERAWSTCRFEGDSCANMLIEALGFIEGDS